jgi:hypothetical protein
MSSRSPIVRTLLTTALLTLSLGAAAQAQTAGTTFPNNQDPSTTSAEQSMQEVGGAGGKQAAVVVQEKVKPVPQPTSVHHHKVTRTTSPKPASSKPQADAPK